MSTPKSGFSGAHWLTLFILLCSPASNQGMGKVITGRIYNKYGLATCQTLRIPCLTSFQTSNV